MDVLWVSGSGVRAAVDPAYGARVTSLVDTRTGRDWIVPGRPSPNKGEDAAYLGDEAAGWDECFPNVDRFAAGAPWNVRLRDHGLVWGRPWALVERTEAAVVTRFDDPLFDLTRRLACDDSVITADYALGNRSEAPMPFLWAMHLLLAAQPGDRIDLPGVDSVEVNYMSRAVDGATPARLAWPGPDRAVGFPLDRVQPIETGVAAKLYAGEVPARSASLVGRDGTLRIRWQAPWASLGIWLNYGGWPNPDATHHIALEPTTAPTGIFGPESISLAPGERIAWRVVLDVVPSPA